MHGVCWQAKPLCCLKAGNGTPSMQPCRRQEATGEQAEAATGAAAAPHPPILPARAPRLLLSHAGGHRAPPTGRFGLPGACRRQQGEDRLVRDQTRGWGDQQAGRRSLPAGSRTRWAGGTVLQAAAAQAVAPSGLACFRAVWGKQVCSPKLYEVLPHMGGEEEEK